MTRISRYVALALGLLLLGGGWAAEMWDRAVLGASLFVLASLVPRSAVAHLGMVGLALGVLAVTLPSYYREPRFWPDLALIGLASVVFAIGLLGFLLDHYRGPKDRR